MEHFSIGCSSRVHTSNLVPRSDGYAAFLCAKHPAALSQPASAVWPEIWEQVGPRAELALHRGEGTYDEALPFIMLRNGYPEETYVTFSYSPIPDDGGGFGGILCPVTDETQRIISERQLGLLRELATRTADVHTWQEACTQSASALESDSGDLPFALIYTGDPEKKLASLAGVAGLSRGTSAAPERVTFMAPCLWPIGEVFLTRRICRAPDLASVADHLPLVRGHHVQQGVAVSIAPSGETGIAGVLVVGLNPLRLFDERYQRFLELVAGEISAALARGQAEEKLRRSEAHLAQDQRLSKTGSGVWIPSTGELLLSREHCRIFGVNPDTPHTTYSNFLERIHPSDRPFVERALTKAGQEESAFEVDYRIVLPNGAIKNIHTIGQPLPKPPDGPPEFVTTVMDISERKLAEEKLRRSEACLADGERLSHTASWAWNASTGEIFWSRELFRIYGLYPDKTIPDYPSVLTRIHPDDRGRARRVFEEAVGERKEYDLAYRVVWADGTIRHVNNIAHPVFDEAGALVEYVGTTIDTTERIQAEATDRPVLILREHTGAVTGITFSSKGDLMASCDAEGEVRLWPAPFEGTHP